MLFEHELVQGMIVSHVCAAEQEQSLQNFKCFNMLIIKVGFLDNNWAKIFWQSFMELEHFSSCFVTH